MVEIMTTKDDRATSPLSGSSHVEDNLSDLDELETPKVEPTDDGITFQIIVGGSLRGKCKLKDSLGYSYTLKCEKPPDKAWWRCSKRTKSFRCGASVSQVGDTFTIGRYPHEHPPDPDIEPTPRAKKRRAMKKAMMEAEAAVADEMSMQMMNNGDSDLDMSDVGAGDMYEGDSSQILIKIERERLQIDTQRLKVEKERLEVAKQILEELKNHNCKCSNPAINQIVM